MLKIRLQRRGKNKYATYRVVIADKDAPVKGRFVADVGAYNPHTNAFTVDQERVSKWLAQGAKPSATVHNLLVTHGLLKAEKITIWRPPVTPEPAPTPAAAAPTESAPETPSAADEKNTAQSQ